ncbi:MAG: tetratricopeptide repeat protein [Acidimicrobiales bacterium]
MTGTGTAPQAAAPKADPDALAAMEEQREFLLRSLDDLERERGAGDIDEASYRALVDDYTYRAAEVLRAMDEGRAALAGTPTRPPTWRGRLGVVAVVAVLAVVAGLAVAASSGSRRLGETITGDIEVRGAARLREAAALAQEGQVAEALERYDQVLAGDPDNVEALAERGLLLVSVAQATDRPALAIEGRESVERALELRPDDPRSLFYLGLALRLEGEAAGADQAFRRALGADPPPPLREAIEGFLQSVGPMPAG